MLERYPERGINPQYFGRLVLGTATRNYRRIISLCQNPIPMQPSRSEQYTRAAAVALLILGCVLVLAPFLGAILFAGVLCLSTWPAYAWLRDRWKGRATLAALALVL